MFVNIGSLQEQLFKLMTFGIPVQVLPISSDGKIHLEHHKLWLEQRKNREAHERNGAVSASEAKHCVIPGPKDVIFGRDSIARTHLGNARYINIIASHQQQYDDCPTTYDRTIIAADIVLRIKESGGRFLKLDRAGRWVVVDDEAAKDKVTSAFRGRRRRSKIRSGDSEAGGMAKIAPSKRKQEL